MKFLPLQPLMCGEAGGDQARWWSAVSLRCAVCLQEQAAGSMSSLEGFSPSSHSELSRRPSGLGGDEGRLGGDEGGLEIPWVLIPITGSVPLPVSLTQAQQLKTYTHLYKHTSTRTHTEF